MLGGLLGGSDGGSGPIAIASSGASSNTSQVSNSSTSSQTDYAPLRTADYDEEAEIQASDRQRLLTEKYIKKQMKKQKRENQRIDHDNDGQGGRTEGGSNSSQSGSSSDEERYYSSSMLHSKRKQDSQLLKLSESMKRLTTMSFNITNELELQGREILYLEDERDEIVREASWLQRITRWITRQESPAIQLCLGLFIVICLTIAAIKIYFSLKE